MISIKIKKITRDLYKNLPRTVMSILAIAVGIIGIGAVVYAYSVLSREMDSNFRITNPASAAIETDRDASLYTSVVAGVDGVKEVEARGIYRGRIAAGKDEWKTIVLFIIDDFSKMHLNLIAPEKGAWPPRKGEILIERVAFPMANTKIGNAVEVELPGVRSLNLTVAGIIHDAGQAPAWMEGTVYGYMTRETFALFGINELNRIIFSAKDDHDHSAESKQLSIHDKIRDLFHPENHDNIDTVSGKVIEAFKERAISVRLVAPHAHDTGSVPKTGTHPHQGQMSSLLFLLGSFGILAFILSGFTVYTLMSSILAREVRAIGIMKAIGGSERNIGFIYFSGVFILACIALVIGLPLALRLGNTYSAFAAGMLNFNIINPYPPVWVIPVIVLTGLAMPLLSSAIPVLGGIKHTVRDAMSDYGVKGSEPGKGKIFSKTGSAFGSMMIMPVRNILRIRARTLLTILMLASGGITFMAALNTGTSISATLREIERSYKYNVEVKFAKYIPNRAVEKVFSFPGVESVESWIDITGCRITGKGVQEREFRILAIPTGSKMIDFSIVSGRWFHPGEMNVIIVNQRWLAAEHGVNVGDFITVRIGDNDKRVQIIGSVRMIAASTAFLPYPMLGEYAEGLTNSIRVSSPVRADELIREINAKAKEAGVPVSMIFSRSDYSKAMEAHFLIIVSFLMIMALFIIVVAAISLSSTMSVAVIERYREIGIMRAVGASTKQILSLIIAESMLIALFSFIIALILAGPMSLAIGSKFINIFLQTSIDFAFASYGIFIWFGLLMLITFLASIIPGKNAASLSVRSAISYE